MLFPQDGNRGVCYVTIACKGSSFSGNSFSSIICPALTILLRFLNINFINKMILPLFYSFIRFSPPQFRHGGTSYGKRGKLHNTGLHIRREFLADINRTPCPVGLRKEQMDYRARTDPLQLLRTPLSSFSFSASSSRLSSSPFCASFARARFSVVFYLA